MVRQIISVFLFFFCFICNAQQYIGNKGKITFFSEAPIENISAVNNNVSAVYDSDTQEIVFQLKIKDFIFPKKLMQEHFNENYLESDIYPTSIFQGKVFDQNTDIKKTDNVRVQGSLSIHGEKNQIVVEGELFHKQDVVNIKAHFSIKLEDYNIDIPKLVIYNIAEVIEINVDIELKEIL